MFRARIRGVGSLLFLGLLRPFLVHGQDFDIPPTWHKPNSTIPRSERLARAQAAVESLVPSFDASNGTVPPLNVWVSANLLASIAHLDYLSESQDYHDLVKSNMAAFQNSNRAFMEVPKNSTRDPIMWGLAAFYGSRAYNDTDLLAIAQGLWNTVQQFVVSAQDAAAGTQHSRNGTFTSHCIANSNETPAGAVFWLTTSTDFRTLGESVSAYVALSAHLWKATGNMTYLMSANQSALFMYTYMWAGGSSSHPDLFWDGWDLQQCQVPSDPIGFYSYDQGFIMEALTVLGNAPLPNNAFWTSLLQTLVASTIPYYQWTSDTGVMNETSNINFNDNEMQLIYKDVFIRALWEIWSQTNATEPMAMYIQAFIMVQYNALLELAGDGDVYSPLWTSDVNIPLPKAWGQLEAMAVLNTAVALPPTSNSSSSPPSGVTSSPPSPSTGIPSPSSLSGGAIAGIVRRSRREVSAASNARHPENDDMTVINPFRLSGPRPMPTDGTRSSNAHGDLPARKDRPGYGLAEVAEPSQPSHSTPLPADISTETAPLEELSETSITRLVNQLMRRIQAQENPPAVSADVKPVSLAEAHLVPIHPLLPVDAPPPASSAEVLVSFESLPEDGAFDTQSNDSASMERIIGRIFAWTCTTRYLTSRLPQIWKNYVRKSVEGLSVFLFIFAFLGNFFYVLSILTAPNMSLPPPEAAAYLKESIPYLLGSGGTLMFDVTIVCQTMLYRPKAAIQARRSSLSGGVDERECGHRRRYTEAAGRWRGWRLRV
ncbi:unnamed protein product [Peniophora sp. CBMAI 1063]|nr:unnamed protein product [Peniophora sp. CBMAI 1063]